MATGDEILDMALALVEAEGAEALTMRRLAGEVGVATTTIYWHVGNRDDLVTAVVRRHGEQMARTPVNGDTAPSGVLHLSTARSPDWLLPTVHLLSRPGNWNWPWPENSRQRVWSAWRHAMPCELSPPA